MTQQEIVRFIKRGAARVRKDAKGPTTSLGDRFVADIEARTLERLAQALEAVPADQIPQELTPPVGTEIPPGAMPPKPILTEGG